MGQCGASQGHRAVLCTRTVAVHGIHTSRHCTAAVKGGYQYQTATTEGQGTSTETTTPGLYGAGNWCVSCARLIVADQEVSGTSVCRLVLNQVPYIIRVADTTMSVNVRGVCVLGWACARPPLSPVFPAHSREKRTHLRREPFANGSPAQVRALGRVSVEWDPVQFLQLPGRQQ